MVSVLTTPRGRTGDCRRSTSSPHPCWLVGCIHPVYTCHGGRLHVIGRCDGIWRVSEHFVEVVALVVGRTAGPEVFAYELSLAAVDLDLAAVGLHDLLLGLPFGQNRGYPCRCGQCQRKRRPDALFCAYCENRTRHPRRGSVLEGVPAGRQVRTPPQPPARIPVDEASRGASGAPQGAAGPGRRRTPQEPADAQDGPTTSR